MLIVVGDIGGTNARFEIYRQKKHKEMDLMKSINLKSGDYTNFDDCFQDLLTKINENLEISICVLSIAGPVLEGECKLCEQNWPPVSEASIQDKYSVKKCKIINDYYAIGYGIQKLDSENIIPIPFISNSFPCNDPKENLKLVAGIGTGLGVCFIVQQEDSFEIFNSEAAASKAWFIDEEMKSYIEFMRFFFI